MIRRLEFEASLLTSFRARQCFKIERQLVNYGLLWINMLHQPLNYPKHIVFRDFLRRMMSASLNVSFEQFATVAISQKLVDSEARSQVS